MSETVETKSNFIVDTYQKLKDFLRSFPFYEQFSSALFVVPAVIIFGMFYIFPFFQLFWLSFNEWDGIGGMTFIGLRHFQDLLGDEIWWKSMVNAGYITLIALTFQNFLAFSLALACDREMRLKSFYRFVFFIPPVLAEVVVGIIWNWIFNSQMQDGQYIGILNHMLHSMGLHHLINNWLSNPETALPCIAFVHSWKGFGWGFIMLLAGLQTIDHQLYEAAKVDGAGPWQTFKNVTIPMMMPVIMVVVILTILGSMQVFVLILSMVNKGLVYHTEVPVTRILAAMSGTNEFGYASAMAVVFGIILVVVSVVMKFLSNLIKQE